MFVCLYCYRTYWEPTVRRRINFDDPDDAEKEMKLAMFKLMIMTSKRKEELRIQEAESRKRKREEEVKPKEVVRRTKPVQTYAKKMRFIWLLIILDKYSSVVDD